MSLFGKQHRYCPNCGKHLYDDGLSNTHVKSLMCSLECIRQWEWKYTGKILGKDANADTDAI